MTTISAHSQSRLLWLAALGTLLAGCGSPLIKAGPQTVDGLALSTPVAWTAFGFKGERTWTRDGLNLNALRIYTDIEPGVHVFRQRLRGPVDEGARFRAGLSAIEIQELILEALRSGGLSNVSATDLRPARLAGRPGFRSELAFDSAAGLHYRGMLLGEGEDGTLSFLLYTAPAEHYYEQDQAAVAAIFASLER